MTGWGIFYWLWIVWCWSRLLWLINPQQTHFHSPPQVTLSISSTKWGYSEVWSINSHHLSSCARFGLWSEWTWAVFAGGGVRGPEELMWVEPLWLRCTVVFTLENGTPWKSEESQEIKGKENVRVEQWREEETEGGEGRKERLCLVLYSQIKMWSRRSRVMVRNVIFKPKQTRCLQELLLLKNPDTRSYREVPHMEPYTLGSGGGGFGGATLGHN